MRVPKIHGVIRRRLLVNFRVAPDAIRRVLPHPFAPKLHRGKAIAGICLIRLEQIRPKRFPKLLGLSSENAAHRIAVTWNEDGVLKEGVYIPRRDTGSLMNNLAGGRIFPGEHHRAHFDVEETLDRIELHMKSSDGSVTVDVAATFASHLPPASSFASVAEASAFFESGSLGYSATAGGRRLDGLELKTRTWHVEPLAVEYVRSSFFDGLPPGSVEFDCALIMRNIEHEWNAATEMYVEDAARS